MEYLDGLDLTALVRTFGPQSPARVVHVLVQACLALVQAHRVGLVHRDVTPSNLVLCRQRGVDDVVKLIDFGLAQRVADLRRGRIDTIAGTPDYLSPEAIREPGAVGPRSDLYGLGAVGWFLLTGRPPFDGDGFVELCAHHLYTPPLRPSKHLGRDLPRDLEDVLLWCLQKDPERRPGSAAMLADALGRCAAAGGWNERDATAWWAARAHVGRVGGSCVDAYDTTLRRTTLSDARIETGASRP
jgi:serine/threonine-protein kinase